MTKLERLIAELCPDGMEYTKLWNRGGCSLAAVRDNDVKDPHDPDYAARENHEFWSRAVRYTQIINLPDMLLRHRSHDSSIIVLQKALHKNRFTTVELKMGDIKASAKERL